MKFHKPDEVKPASSGPQKKLPNRIVLIGLFVVISLIAFAGGILIDRSGLLGKLRLKTEAEVQSAVTTADKNI